MKTLKILLLSFFPLFCYSQNYALDTSFGFNGVKKYTSSGFDTKILPVETFYINNKYIIVQGAQISRFELNGNMDVSFGTSGSIKFNDTNNYYHILGAKLENGFIFLYGNVSSVDNSYEKRNVFLLKISVDGVLDTTFGNGGIFTFNVGNGDINPNTGDNDTFNDIFIDINQNIYAIGYYYTAGTLNQNICVLKITSAGILDTSFNSTGIRTYGEGIGYKIINHQGNNLMVCYTSGTSKLIQIDSAGNYDLSFGTNGIKTIPNPTDETYPSLTNAYLFNDNIYLDYLCGAAQEVYGVVKVHNLSSLVLVNSIALGRNCVFKEDNGKLYIGDGTCSYCNEENFRLRRYNNNSTLDTTFNTTGEYTYNFVSSSSSKDFILSFYIHNDGNIMMSGFSSQAPSANYIGMIRIGNSTLGINNNIVENPFMVFPNPSNGIINITDNNQPIEQLTVSDLTGKVLITDNSDRRSIDIGILQKGLYFLKINSNGKSYSLKIIKE